MRTLVLFCLALLLVGCGRTAPALQWPAHVDSMEGFSDSETSKMKQYITSLNGSLGDNAVLVDGNQGSAITIKLVTDFSSSTSGTATSDQMPASTGLMIAGRATLTDGHCTIEIGKFIAEDNTKDYFQPVLWHELGHCAGLVHVSDSQQIMSPTTLTWETYSKDELSTFISSFVGSAGLKASN